MKRRRGSPRVGFDWSQVSNDLPFLGLLALCVLATFWSVKFIYAQGLNGPPIRSDGYGYYAYLTTVFIDHNLSFSTAITHAPPPGDLGQAYGIAVDPETGRMIDKYTPGTALLEAPSFLAGHLTALLSGAPADGYSKPYQTANTISGMVYFAIGLAAIYWTIRRRTGQLTALLTAAAVAGATNLFHYATYDSSFSHVYSFAIVALYLLALECYREDPRPSAPIYGVLFGLLLGLAVLIRPPNAFLALLAVAAMGQKRLPSRAYPALIREFAATGLTGFLTVLPLFLYWRAQTGHFVLNSYGLIATPGGVHEHFNWLRPEVLKFLFSVDRGLFFWAPVLFLSCWGLAPLIAKDRIWGWAVAATLAIEIYVCSSWWAWNFGASFGSRPFVDMLPIAALPMSLALNMLRRKAGLLSAIALITVLSAVNLTLMYGYWRHYIPYSGTTWPTLTQWPGRLIGLKPLLLGPKEAKRVSLTVVSAARTPDGSARFVVRVHNGSRVGVASDQGDLFRLSWAPASPRMFQGVHWDPRVDLPRALPSGGDEDVSITVPANRLKEAPGVGFSFVEEGRFWGHDIGVEPIWAPAPP